MDDEDERHRGDYLNLLIQTSLPTSGAAVMSSDIASATPASNANDIAASGASAVTVDRDKVLAALGAVEKAREAVAALQVPSELLAFLHLGEPTYAGIVRLNEEWGGKAGDLVLERKLLKLISVWLSRYQVWSSISMSPQPSLIKSFASQGRQRACMFASLAHGHRIPTRSPMVRLSRRKPKLQR